MHALRDALTAHRKDAEDVRAREIETENAREADEPPLEFKWDDLLGAIDGGGTFLKLLTYTPIR